MSILQQLSDRFSQAFSSAPQGIVRAPGRVNLIGEHTDYNDGFCLPIAIERAVWVAWGRHDGQGIGLSHTDPTQQSHSIPLHQPLNKEEHTPWYSYVQGCVQILQAAGLALRPCNLAFYGDVPMGSGLSSSAALEVASIHALLAASEISASPEQIAIWAQQAENSFVGVQCGILDQLSSACCQAGHAMLMDCRSRSLLHVPLPENLAIVIADTGKRRGLVESAYNERRQQCEAGAKALGISHLRDASLQGLMTAARAGDIDDLTKLRCEHVVAENGRCRAAAACLRAGDAEALGLLMDQSHADLRDKFAVSCQELDDMVALARALPGCLGARMTGAGFGGCAVALILKEHATDFVSALLKGYTADHSLPAAVFVSAAAAGAGPQDY